MKKKRHILTTSFKPVRKSSKHKGILQRAAGGGMAV